ncbi:PLAC8 family-domain-containing protein [Crepidotus variabilis]|uniref:PLAC8 family-domain-containing protein n=1 Tax=Crepidotus variabilis TaxID=179855 RepID=A0A9P6EBI0_9AGAR|nr:PLAC8 family-domain-containing protein [Crepidotus variabilis]
MSYPPQQPMTIGNRNVKGLIEGPEGRKWSHELCNNCECFGATETSSVCPCIIFGKVKHRYRSLNRRGSPDPEKGGCCSADCVIHGTLAILCFGWVMQMMLRGNIRDRYNIQGNSCGDCCEAFWCSPCELTQESRELELEEQTYGRSLDPQQARAAAVAAHLDGTMDR